MRRFSPAMTTLCRSISSAFLSSPRCFLCASFYDESIGTKAMALVPMRFHRRCIATDSEEDKVIEAFNRSCSTGKDGHASDSSACNAYVEKLCRSGCLSDAVRVLLHLHDERIHVSLGTFNVLLQQASEANSFTLFAKIFRYLLLSKVPPDLTSYMSIAKALQKVDDHEQILKFVREVLEITCSRDPTVMNRIIFAAAEYGQLEKSLMIFEELKGNRQSLDAVTFNTVLDMLGKAGQVDQMLSELSLMKELGHAPDIVTYNTVINCLRRLGRLDLCKFFAREMLERGLDPDFITYKALIDSFGRAGHINEALEMFNQMKKSHQPSVYVYRALIDNLKKSGWFESAEKLYEEMKSRALELSGPEDAGRKFQGRSIRKQGR